MDSYATHVPVLAWAAAKVRPVYLELGCGDYSTPLLARMGQVDVVTSDREWGQKYEDIASVRYIESWDGFRVEGDYGLIFLDNEETVTDRWKHIGHLLNRAEMVVMHDYRDALGIPAGTTTHGVYRRLKPMTFWGSKCLRS